MITPYLSGDSTMSKVVYWPVIPCMASDVGVMAKPMEDSLFAVFSASLKAEEVKIQAPAFGSHNLRLGSLVNTWGYVSPLAYLLLLYQICNAILDTVVTNVVVSPNQPLLLCKQRWHK